MSSNLNAKGSFRNIYNVKYLDKSISDPTEFLPKHEWDSANSITDFKSPWDTDRNMVTEFKALYNLDYLILKYYVEDSCIHCFNESRSKMDVVLGDRIEIFFAKDAELNSYYCLEIDPSGRILDYSAKYYREFNFSWAWPKDSISVIAETNSSGYGIEVYISLLSMQNLGIIHGQEILAGIYRANCLFVQKSTEVKGKFQWLTWVDPLTDEPDFHLPSSFGILKLVK